MPGVGVQGWRLSSRTNLELIVERTDEVAQEVRNFDSFRRRETTTGSYECEYRRDVTSWIETMTSNYPNIAKMLSHRSFGPPDDQHADCCC